MENSTVTTNGTRMKTWKIVSLVILYLAIVSAQLYGLFFVGRYAYNTLDVVLFVKPCAEEIDKGVKSGQVKPEDLEKLIAYRVDPKAIKYWKENYSK